MGDLREAIKQLEIRGSRVATQAANDGIGTDLVKVLEAARCWLDLTSDQNVEAGMEAVRPWDLSLNDYARSEMVRAVLEAVRSNQP